MLKFSDVYIAMFASAKEPTVFLRVICNVPTFLGYAREKDRTHVLINNRAVALLSFWT